MHPIQFIHWFDNRLYEKFKRARVFSDESSWAEQDKQTFYKLLHKARMGVNFCTLKEFK